MNYVLLLEQVKEELIRFFHIHEIPALSFHNFEHTKMVVANAGQIGRHYQLDDHDFFVVVTAAWFHDTGYYLTGKTNHEIAGADKAKAFLSALGVDNQTIEQIRNCILATSMPQSPRNLLEQIVCDADLFHLGTNDFFSINKLIRKEAMLRSGNKLSKSDWSKSTIQLMEAHQYKTAYARKLLQEKKQQNIAALKELKNEETRNDLTAGNAINNPLPMKETSRKTEVNGKISKETDRPVRGIETMFRVSSNNHQRLSDMADNKAHIMITTTSIILSVLLSVLLRKLEDNPHLIFPTFLLLIVCVITMVFSILATRPTLPNGTFSEKDIEEKKVSLLFFGNFYRMNYDDYSHGIQKLMNKSEYLYGSLTRDVYSQGIVLGRKYRLLRIAYNIFMYGVVLSVIAFTLAVMYIQ